MKAMLHPRRASPKNASTRNLLTRGLRWLLAATLTIASNLGQIAPAGTQGYQLAERGEDFSVYQKVTVRTNSTGQVISLTNSFTLLENAVNYFEDNQWKTSEDLIEPFPDGAIARRGPHKGIFSSDLNAAAVFDILASDGKRLRGSVRAIQLTDVAAGKSLVLATVKASAPGHNCCRLIKLCTPTASTD